MQGVRYWNANISLNCHMRAVQGIDRELASGAIKQGEARITTHTHTHTHTEGEQRHSLLRQTPLHYILTQLIVCCLFLMFMSR